MSRTARMLTIILPLLFVALSAAADETLQGSGGLRIPTESVGIEGVDVVPIQSMNGKSVKVTWKMHYLDRGGSGDREGMLVLFIRFEVPEGTSPPMRLDFAFFDEKDQLLYTWDMTEYEIKTDAENDPKRFPTWNLFATDDLGLTWSALGAVRSYKIVVRTVAE